jgi:arabinogalactan oligomer/maltooligosaccharide transport system permease protein
MATDIKLPLTPIPSNPPQETSWKQSASFRATVEVWLIRIIIWIVLAAVLFPVIYVLIYSLKGGGGALYSETFIPEVLTFANYTQLLDGNFPNWIKNSLILGLASGFLTVIFATFAGYAFSRMRFPGRRYGILVLLIIQMLPVNMAIVAYYRLLQLIELNNTRLGIILIFGFGGSALAVWLMKNFIDSIPKDLDEAAYIDGASHWGVFWRIIFPLAQPMLVAQFIFGFIGVYNEYIMTTILLADPSLYPLGVGVRTFATQFNTSWTLFCAAAVLGSIPILIVFFLAQRLLVEGLTRGAVKG